MQESVFVAEIVSAALGGGVGMGVILELEAFVEQALLAHFGHPYFAQDGFQDVPVFAQGVVDVAHIVVRLGLYMVVVVVAAVVVAKLLVAAAFDRLAAGKTGAHFGMGQ